MSKSDAYWLDTTGFTHRYKLKRAYKECGCDKYDDCCCDEDLEDEVVEQPRRRLLLLKR